MVSNFQINTNDPSIMYLNHLVIPKKDLLELMTEGRMLKHSVKIPYHQGTFMTRSNYKENWHPKTFPYEEGALKWYAKNFLRDVQGRICWRCCRVFFS